MADALVIIPARMAATRLPGKPLADIAGKPMVVRVLERAAAAGVGPVAVATDTEAIAEAAEAAGFRAVMTRADHPSGSDRVHEAAGLLDPAGEHRVIINVQGDFPTLDPRAIASVAALMDDPAVSIGTLGAVIHDDEEKTNPNVVKVVGAPLRPGRLRALYFTRATAPWGEGDLIHHVGIYGYRRPVLDAFVALPPSPLETREKLEQLRALEAGFRIDVALIGEVPRGVDTPADLERTRALYAAGRMSLPAGGPQRHD